MTQDKSIEINNQATKYFLGNEFEKAEKLYNEALGLNPESPTVLNNLGLLYHQKKQYDTAYEYFMKALKIEEKNTYLLNAGNAMACMNNLDEAASLYKKVIEKDYQNIAAIESLANLYEYKKEYTKAAQYWKVLANQTGKAEYFIALAKNQMQARQFKSALELLYHNNLRNSATSWHLVGICEYELRNLGLAVEAFKQALGIEPDWEATRQYLAVTLLKAGDTHSAIEEMSKIIKINPQNYHVLTDLGVVFLSQKRVDDAIKLFEEALTIKPDFEKALKYKKSALEMDRA